MQGGCGLPVSSGPAQATALCHNNEQLYPHIGKNTPEGSFNSGSFTDNVPPRTSGGCADVVTAVAENEAYGDYKNTP